MVLEFMLVPLTQTTPGNENQRMSSPPKSATARRGQQTLHEAVNSHLIQNPITGVHARFDLPREEKKLRKAQNHQYVVLNFSEVEKIIERDGGLGEVLKSHHVPVILGTEDDKIIDERSFQNVLDVLGVAQPAIYVPDIVYSYTWMDDEDQESAIEAYICHVRTLQQVIIDRNLTIRLIPTNKGWMVEHFEEYQDLYEDFGYKELAFYAVGYTGGDAGNATRKIRRHTSNAIAALGLRNVFVIGRLAWDDLLRFDPEVNGACGLRGIDDDVPFPEFQEKHERALYANNDQTQSYLDKYQ